MKISVFNASPKRGASDTMHITRAFLEGMAQVAQNDVKVINLYDKHIEYCKGCFACMRNGGNCVIDDDMKELLKIVLESDVLLFSFPLYCYGMPASLKAFTDRTLPLTSMAMRKVGERYEHLGQADFSKLKYVMVSGCGFPNYKKNFEPAKMQFELMFPSNHTMICVPESPMFNAPEASAVTIPRLERIKEAGKRFAECGSIDDVLLKEIESPMIPEDVYAKICNGEM